MEPDDTPKYPIKVESGIPGLYLIRTDTYGGWLVWPDSKEHQPGAVKTSYIAGIAVTNESGIDETVLALTSELGEAIIGPKEWYPVVLALLTGLGQN